MVDKHFKSEALENQSGDSRTSGSVSVAIMDATHYYDAMKYANERSSLQNLNMSIQSVIAMAVGLAARREPHVIVVKDMFGEDAEVEIKAAAGRNVLLKLLPDRRREASFLWIVTADGNDLASGGIWYDHEKWIVKT